VAPDDLDKARAIYLWIVTTPRAIEDARLHRDIKGCSENGIFGKCAD